MVYSHATLAPGYSVAVLHKAHGFSYVAGAPRHKLRGAVFELQKDRESTFVRRMEGEQVPPGEVTFPSVGALGPGEMGGWAHPGQGPGLSVIQWPSYLLNGLPLWRLDCSPLIP